jgi:hypothetical protein
MPGYGGPATFTVAEPIAAALATLVAWTVTCAGLGIVFGAVYRPEAETVPMTLLPPAVPLTLQVTDAFPELVTVDANCCVPTGAMVTGLGATVTVTGGGGGGRMVTVAVPAEAAFAALVA